MHLRMDGESGAVFAADTIAPDEAVVSMISTPRHDGDARAEHSAAFLREWLAALPSGVSRVTTWASSGAASAFLRNLGFEDQPGYVTPEGGRGMALERRLAA